MACRVDERHSGSSSEDNTNDILGRSLDENPEKCPVVETESENKDMDEKLPRYSKQLIRNLPSNLPTLSFDSSESESDENETVIHTDSCHRKKHHNVLVQKTLTAANSKVLQDESGTTREENGDFSVDSSGITGVIRDADQRKIHFLTHEPSNTSINSRQPKPDGNEPSPLSCIPLVSQTQDGAYYTLQKEKQKMSSRGGLSSICSDFDDDSNGFAQNHSSLTLSPDLDVALEDSPLKSDSGIFDSPSFVLPSDTSDKVENALAELERNNMTGFSLDFQHTTQMERFLKYEIPSTSDALLSKLQNFTNYQKQSAVIQNELIPENNLQANNTPIRSSGTAFNSSNGRQNPQFSRASAHQITSWSDIKATNQCNCNKNSDKDSTEIQETVFLDLRPNQENHNKQVKDWDFASGNLRSIIDVGFKVEHSRSFSCDEDATNDRNDFVRANQERKQYKQSFDQTKETSNNRKQFRTEGNSSVVKNYEVHAKPRRQPSLSVEWLGSSTSEESNVSEDVRQLAANTCDAHLDQETISMLEEKQKFYEDVSRPAIHALGTFFAQRPAVADPSSSDESSFDEEPVASLTESESESQICRSRNLLNSTGRSELAATKVKRGNFGSYDLVGFHKTNGVSDGPNLRESKADRIDAELNCECGELYSLSPKSAAGCLGSGSVRTSESELGAGMICQEMTTLSTTSVTALDKRASNGCNNNAKEGHHIKKAGDPVENVLVVASADSQLKNMIDGDDDLEKSLKSHYVEPGLRCKENVELTSMPTLQSDIKATTKTSRPKSSSRPDINVLKVSKVFLPDALCSDNISLPIVKSDEHEIITPPVSSTSLQIVERNRRKRDEPSLSCSQDTVLSKRDNCKLDLPSFGNFEVDENFDDSHLSSVDLTSNLVQMSTPKEAPVIFVSENQSADAANRILSKSTTSRNCKPKDQSKTKQTVTQKKVISRYSFTFSSNASSTDADQKRTTLVTDLENDERKPPMKTYLGDDGLHTRRPEKEKSSTCEPFKKPHEIPISNYDSKYGQTGRLSSESGHAANVELEKNYVAHSKCLIQSVSSKGTSKKSSTIIEATESTDFDLPSQDRNDDILKSKKKNKKRSSKNATKALLDDKCEYGEKETGKKHDIVGSSSLKESPKPVESTKKPKTGSGKKEADVLKLKEIIRRFQITNDFPPIIYDEVMSFTEDVSSLPSRAHEKSCLLLKVPLQAPCVCSRQQTSKAALPVLEGINAYIGLSTLFLSLLPHTRINVASKLEIPFNVVSFQQNILENELCLCIGIIENDVPAKTIKRGKQSKSKRTFFQGVTQFLNSNDLETLLEKLERLTSTRGSFVRSMSCGKLSSFVSVNPDEDAVRRIFSLSPSLFWKSEYKPGAPLSSGVTWLPNKQHKDEITVLTVERITRVSPRSLYFLFMKILTMDVVGIRLAYLHNTDSSEDKTILVLALSDLSSTSVQGASKLVPALHDEAGLFVSYMPRDLKVMQTYSGDPLVTYGIGRRRADRELTFWFGKRLNKCSERELLTELDNFTKPCSKDTKKPHCEVDSHFAQTSVVYYLMHSVSRSALTLSPLVPSWFLFAVIEKLEKLGLSIIALGKTNFSLEKSGSFGLTLNSCRSSDTFGDKASEANKSSFDVPVSGGMWIFVLEGVNTVYRSMRLISGLADELFQLLPADSSTQEKDRGNSGWDANEKRRSINDFFGSVPLTSKNVQYIEEMFTTPELPNFRFEELKARMPMKHHIFSGFDQPEFCIFVVTGKQYIDRFVEILRSVLSYFSKEQLNHETMASPRNGFYTKEKPSIEVIGVKYFPEITMGTACEVNPFVVGSLEYDNLSERLIGHPVVVLVLRGPNVSRTISQALPTLEKKIGLKSGEEKLQLNEASSHNIFLFEHRMTVIRFMMTFFSDMDLCYDFCSAQTKRARWPVYLDANHWTLSDSAYFKIPHNFVKALDIKNVKSVHKQHPINKKLNILKVVHPFCLSLPHQLLLTEDSQAFTVLTVHFDQKYPKTVSKVLQRIVKDQFCLVGLRYPGTSLNQTETRHKMLIALRRQNAVERLLNWLPLFTKEMNGKHVLNASKTAAEALEDILVTFKTSKGSGIFDWSLVSLAEELSFTVDDVFHQRNGRSVTWLDPRKSESSASDSENQKDKTKCNENLFGSLLEVTVILISNGLLRARCLNRRLPDNLVYFGFWEKLSSLSFETVGMRMTSLTSDQLKVLLDECGITCKRKVLERTLAASNGPLIALALQRDFAITNFWTLVEKHYDDQDLSYLQSNVLVPTNQRQVEVLLQSLFETVAKNPKVEITQISSEIV